MAPTTAPDLDQRIALLDEWVRTRRQIAALEARESALLARRWELMEADVREEPLHRDAILRSMVAEYSAAGRIAKGSVEFAFTDAQALAEHLPVVRDAFGRGEIRAAHVREIVRAASVVHQAIRDGEADASTLDAYEEAALAVAEVETPARTRVYAKEIAAALAGRTTTGRQADAHAERTVTLRDLGDGNGLIQAVLPLHIAEAIFDRLTRMAEHQAEHPDDREPTLPPAFPEPTGPEHAGPAGDPADLIGEDDLDAAGDDARWEMIRRMLEQDPLFHPDSPYIHHVPPDARTRDQRRADLFADLLLSADPSAAHGTGLDNIIARIQVTVAATTLAGLDDRPAQLDGAGPLHPDVARALAGRSTGWTRLFLNPAGLVTETDTYTPTEPMRRHLRARDQHCRFPGCRVPVARCQIDHNHDHALGGPTSLDNLSHLCPAHHVLKHPDIPDGHRWTARQLPDWSVEWTSPTGRTYTDPPPRRVMFTPTGPPGTEPATAESEPAAPF